jgi:hypothetical protein
MTLGWAIQLPRKSLTAALPLRLRPGIEALDTGPDLWLRGTGAPDEPLALALRLIPDARRFTVDAAGQLTPDALRLPVGQIPGGNWVPFASLAILRLPPAALPAEIDCRVEVSLIPAEQETEIDAVMVPLDSWTAWCATAPKVRLDRLRIAVRQDQTALILGRPLPSIPGVGLTNHDGLLVPAGLAWNPPVDAATLRRALGLPPGEFVLFDPDGTHERIAAEMFVPAHRRQRK